MTMMMTMAMTMTMTVTDLPVCKDENLILTVLAIWVSGPKKCTKKMYNLYTPERIETHLGKWASASTASYI